jgi:23S rRNA (uracil1939-C5)-methyltransferase
LNYETQLSAKVEIIRDCLHRIAKIDEPLDIVIHPSPKEWQYRARAMWQVDTNDKFLGYFERGTNRVCDVEYCAVLTPALESTLERVRTELHQVGFPERLRDVEVVAGDEGVSIAPPIAGLKTDIVTRVIGCETYHFSAESFFQVNHELLDPLMAEALRNANASDTSPATPAPDATTDSKRTTAIDLYSGVGLFTLPLARRFDRVIGVEGSVKATEFARRNLEFAKRRRSSTVEGLERRLGKVDIFNARVGDWLKQHSGSTGPIDFLLLDPPRTGCENRDIAGILSLHPERITYVSCDPATLARDLKKLITAGYLLDSVVAFDMFPQTHHVETIAHLRTN